MYYYSTGEWQRVHSNSYNVLVSPREELIEWEGGKERGGEEGEGNNTTYDSKIKNWNAAGILFSASGLSFDCRVHVEKVHPE